MENAYRLYIDDTLHAITPRQLQQAIASLPEWRREKALRFKHEQGQKECAFSYLLLCRALHETYGIDEQPNFIIGEHGKPELFFSDTPSGSSPQVGVGEKLHFNLSHCKAAIACVISSHEVGVDVESIGRFKDPLARHVLNDEEYNHVISSSDPQTAFTRYWTQKEAIVKLTGRGIDDDLKNLLLKYNNVSLHTEVYPQKGYVVSVAEGNLTESLSPKNL
ncbi:MAG: 4'-phosphopantetheinyl transferase superfamily protein [Bacteroidaceae bacterium]|nr:4'-phosphopantetheinyl transferase superfamily protein [Bacteroidaceae bacterium]